MGGRILVTRPQPGADATAARLRRLGFEPVVLPLTRIVALDPAPLPVSLAFDAVALTSANAVRHMPRWLAELAKSLPSYVVGGRTADAASAAGLSVAAIAPDAAGLAARIVSLAPRPVRLLHAAGRERTPGLEAALERAGVAVETVEVYAAGAMEPPPCPPDDAPIVAALVFSRRAALLHRGLLESARPSGVLNRTQFLALSDAVAAALPSELATRTRVASRPEEVALLELLAGSG